jgi:hypothetical protein
MKSNWKSILLWLFVINLGIACGAGLYESRVVIPQWAEIPPQDWPNTGLMFWVYVTTIPLTLLTGANLISAWTNRSAKRYWWLSAAGVILLERIATFAYFIPTMVSLTSPELPDATVNHGRHVLSLTGWLMALKALSLPASVPATSGEDRARS